MTVIKENIHYDSKAMIQDAETKNLLSRSLSYLKAGYPVHFTGAAGTGKTSLALALAKKRKKPVMLMHGNHELDNRDLIGDFTGYTSKKVVDRYIRSVYKKDENVTESWQNGRLLEAARNGYTLVYDEFTRSRPATNNIFLSILEEGIIPLYGSKLTEPFVRVHPDFAMIFTSNPAEYAGVYATQDALMDRLITISIDSKDANQEASILSEKIGMDENEAKAITNFIANVRASCANADQNGPGLRASLMIARLTEREGIPVNGENEDFQQLCLDILSYPISHCIETEGGIKEAESLILSKCKEI